MAMAVNNVLLEARDYGVLPLKWIKLYLKLVSLSQQVHEMLFLPIFLVIFPVQVPLHVFMTTTFSPQLFDWKPVLVVFLRREVSMGMANQ